MNDDDGRKRLVATVFDRAASTYDTVAGSYFSFFGRRLVEAAGIEPDSTVLDIACGKGAVLIPAAARCRAVIGTDISFEMVRAARDEAGDKDIRNVAVAVMDADRLASRSDCFDVVTCAFSLHFFVDPRVTMEGFVGVTRPGGVVAISEWGEDDERWAWESELIGDLGIRGVATGWSEAPGELLLLLSESGLENTSVATSSVDVLLVDENEWWKWKWSYSFRYVLEQLDPDVCDRFKAAAFEHVRTMTTPEGIPLTLRANIAIGHKPG